MEKKEKTNSAAKKIQPLADRVLIKELDAKKGSETKSGIYIPESADKEHGSHRGEVIAIGEGRYDDGEIIPVKVSVGDTVIFQWGDKVMIDDEEFWIIGESSILAVVK